MHYLMKIMGKKNPVTRKRHHDITDHAVTVQCVMYAEC